MPRNARTAPPQRCSRAAGCSTVGVVGRIVDGSSAVSRQTSGDRPWMLRGVSFGPIRRRAPMRGGIQKKGNKYYAVVYDGVDPGTGRKRRRWVPAGTRRADAERLLVDLIR